tara:strand:+ start:216 stop:455 length:240 start_codon:yes stop_codon:yes gene_type:complete
MALVKTDHQLEQAVFTFDENGDVADIKIQVNCAVVDDVTGEQETRVRKTVSVKESLSPAISSSAANAFGRRLKSLAEAV